MGKLEGLDIEYVSECVRVWHSVRACVRVSACLQGFYPIRPCECVSTGILDFNNYVLNWYDSTR